MNTYSVKSQYTTEDLLLHELRQHQAPVSWQELEAKLSKDGSLSHRILKEAAWKLVEEGKAQFTASWDLEIC